MLALQHVLTMFGSTVAVPLLLGPAMGLETKDTALLISSVMLCSGIATFLQATFGSRLPIIQGVSFSFLAAFFGIIGTVTASQDDGGFGGDGAMVMQYIAGAVIVGAVAEMVIGFSGLMGVIRRCLSPVVVGPVIMLIGLALYNAGAPVAASHWPTSIMTMCLIVLFSFVLSRRSRIFRIFPLLLAILVSCGVCYALTLLESTRARPRTRTGMPSRHTPPTSAFRRSPFRNGSASSASSSPGADRCSFLPLWSRSWPATLASMIESFGDYHACSQMAGGGDPTPAQISRGIGFEGVGCALTGVFGGFSSTSYSENIGLVGLTKVGSRYVVQIAAVILVALGIFGKFGAVAAAIPKPVVGGLYCTLFGLISAVGVRQLAKADLNVDRNLFVAGFALFMGLSVPAYFGSEAGKAAMLSLGKSSWLASVNEPLAISVRDVVSAIGNTGMAVAAILGLVLDNLIPGTAEQRGLDV